MTLREPGKTIIPKPFSLFNHLLPNGNFPKIGGNLKYNYSVVKRYFLRRLLDERSCLDILTAFTLTSPFLKPFSNKHEQEGINVNNDINRRTQETAAKLFGKGIKMEPPYQMWRQFDKELANDLSRHITGNLYSRTVLTIQERQYAACAMLASLRATAEFKLHVNAALNVGCDPRKITEIIFQASTYAGMPAVNEALEAYREVLKERGEWPIAPIE